eukprot:1161816-Pelagomonas_calceolata.AAC.2
MALQGSEGMAPLDASLRLAVGCFDWRPSASVTFSIQQEVLQGSEGVVSSDVLPASDPETPYPNLKHMNGVMYPSAGIACTAQTRYSYSNINVI